MQRIGRVNRIGSSAKAIYIFNFFPTSKVNNDIELEKKAKMKLFAFHAALGEDSQIYSTDETPESFGLFDKNIDEERDEKLRYLMWLRQLKAENPDLIKHINKLPLRARVGRKYRRCGPSVRRRQQPDIPYFEKYQKPIRCHVRDRRLRDA